MHAWLLVYLFGVLNMDHIYYYRWSWWLYGNVRFYTVKVTKELIMDSWLKTLLIYFINIVFNFLPLSLKV